MPVVFKPKTPSAAAPQEKEPEEAANPLAKKQRKKAAQEKEQQQEQKSGIAFGKQGNVSTEVNHADGSTEHTQENVGGFVVAQKPLASVNVNASVTMNMGNYQSMRIGCMVTLPCDTEQLDSTFEAAQEFVETKMNELIEKNGPKDSE